MAKTKTQQMADGARHNAGAIAAGLPVVLMWVLTTYTGVDMPLEVATAIGGILGAIGGSIRKAL